MLILRKHYYILKIHYRGAIILKSFKKNQAQRRIKVIIAYC